MKSSSRAKYLLFALLSPRESRARGPPLARRSQMLLHQPPITELGWTAEAVAQMPREVHHPSPSELLLSLGDDPPKPPRARSLLLTITQVGPTLSYHFLEPKFGSTPRLATYFSSASRLTFGAGPPPKPSRSLTPKDPITYDQLGLLLREAVPDDPAG